MENYEFRIIEKVMVEKEKNTKWKMNKTHDNKTDNRNNCHKKKKLFPEDFVRQIHFCPELCKRNVTIKSSVLRLNRRTDSMSCLWF